jgi:hypothetical protein
MLHLHNGFRSVNPSTVCQFCNQPFKLDPTKSHYRAFRSDNGHLYCTFACEEADKQFYGDLQHTAVS